MFRSCIMDAPSSTDTKDTWYLCEAMTLPMAFMLVCLTIELIAQLGHTGPRKGEKRGKERKTEKND